MFESITSWFSSVQNPTVSIIDLITEGFLGALEAGGSSLAKYSIALLSVLFVISYTREFGPRLAQGTGSLSDALGAPLLFFISTAGYLYILMHLVPMANAALQTAIQWGTEASGGQFNLSLRKPSLILQAGMDAAQPLIAFDTLWRGLKSAFSLISDPWIMLSVIAILGAFAAITLHFMVMVIEFTMAVSFTYVLLPWALWRNSASVGEFAIGWLVGAVIRALVTTSMIGIAVPLFKLLAQAHPGVPLIPDSIVVGIGAVGFGILSWQVPSRIANWASRAGLALSGSTIAAGAMTFTRFAMMGSGAVRGFSSLVGR